MPIRIAQPLLPGDRAVFAFDMIERSVEGKGANERTLYKPKSDDALHGGMDSAIKSAIHWQRTRKQLIFSLHMPVLVLSKPWLEVPLDGGVAGKPTVNEHTYRTISLPIGPSKSQSRVTSIIVTSGVFPKLIQSLDDAVAWYLRGF